MKNSVIGLRPVNRKQFFLVKKKVSFHFTTTRGQAVALLRNKLTTTQDIQVNTGGAGQQLSRRKLVEALRNSATPTAPTDSNISSNETFF